MKKKNKQKLKFVKAFIPATMALSIAFAPGASVFANETGDNQEVIETNVITEEGLNGDNAVSNESTEEQTTEPSTNSEDTSVDESTTEETVDAGTTPDSFLYTFDKLFEDLQLAFTFDEEKEAQLLIEFAQERLSEAKTMTEEEKVEYVQEAMTDYMAILAEAQEKAGELIADEEVSEEVKDQLSQELEKVTEVDEEIEAALPEETQTELEEQKEQAKLVGAVKDMELETVQALRDQGLGYGQIAQAQLLADASGKSIEEIASLLSGEEKGFGNVAKELGFHPSELKSKGKAKSKNKKESAEVEEEVTVEDGVVEENPTEEVVEEDTTQETITEDAGALKDQLEDQIENGEITAEEATAVFALQFPALAEEFAEEFEEEAVKYAKKQQEKAKKNEERKQKETKKQENQKREEVKKQEAAKQRAEESKKQQEVKHQEAAKKQEEKKREESKKNEERKQQESKKQQERKNEKSKKHKDKEDEQDENNDEDGNGEN